MTDHTDIVEYLRRNAVFNYKDTYIAAADEIERLRAERDALSRLTDRLFAEHDALRAERDEARRASAAWEANLAEPQEIDPADLQALIDAAWRDDRLTVRMSARDLWRMASDHRGRNEE